MNASMKKLQLRSGFTLVEILIVIAISVILFGLLLKPLINSLQYTRQAQTLAAAQDSARVTMETISRELGSATYVLDNESHPFAVAAGAVTVGSDLYTNFLDLQVPTRTNLRTVAHAYNAKLDFVLQRHQNGANGQIDPTTNQPINVVASGVGSARIVGTDTVLSLAPGTTTVRYFAGLMDPTHSYANANEGMKSIDGGPANNTYVLYRAQFQVVLPPSGSTPSSANTALFALSVNGRPEMDDPDFFRYVTAGTDINWLSATHEYYTQTDADAHNQRVDNWVKIAKPIINAPQVELLLLPHNADGKIAYDATGSFTDVAHYGYVLDPTSGAQENTWPSASSAATPEWPVVKTSVTFAPSDEPTQALPASSTEYASLGVPGTASDTGLPFIPSVYSSDGKSWTQPYSVSLYPALYNPTTNGYFSTQLVYVSNGPVPADQPGDLVEYYNGPSGSGSVAVYNVTQGHPEYSSAGVPVAYPFVPFSIDADKGLIDFAVQGRPPVLSKQPPLNPLPATSGSNTTYYDNANNVYYYFGANDINNTAVNTGGVGQGMVNLAQTVDVNGVADSPLAASPALSAVPNAHLVPGSVRVFGPDSNSGPTYGQSIPYSPIEGLESPGPDQYSIDYANNLIRFHQVQLVTSAGTGVGSDLPVTAGTQIGASGSAPVQISYDYQANITLAGAGPVSTANPATPLLVNVNYSSRDTMDVKIGVRVYNPGTNHAQIISNDSKIRVGNSNR